MNTPQTLSGTALTLVRQGRKLLDQVFIELIPGELHAVLGANGAGKSSLLRVLAGELRPDVGILTLNGRALFDYPARERAQLRAVMAQTDSLQADFSAEQVVALGRYSAWRQAPEVERAFVTAALEQADVAHLAQARYLTLSGGERRRVQLARTCVQLAGPLPPALAGAARYLLLDEPTAALDLAHRHAGLRLARRFAAEGIGVLAVLHDPDLAMQYADRVTLLGAGRTITAGAPEAVLTPDFLRQAYAVEIVSIAEPGRARPTLLVRPPLEPP